MAGQGSLRQRNFRSRGKLPAAGLLCALLAAQLALSPLVSMAEQAGETIDVRLRCQWESKEARFWTVRLSVIEPGAQTRCISEVENYSASEKTTGSLELSNDANVLSFQPRQAIPGGAVQFRVRASREAKLSIEFPGDARNDAASHAQLPPRELPLVQIISDGTIHGDTPAGSREVAGQPTWTLTRIPGDELRIENIRSLPVYEPGDQLDLSVRSNALVGYASRALILQYSLYRVSHGETVASHRLPIKVNAHGDCEPVTINEAVPEQPGVYEIRCQITKDDDSIWSRLRRRDPPIVRLGRPIVVLPKAGLEQVTPSAAWRSVGVIRPSESSWSVGQWLPKQTTRLIPGADPQKTGAQDNESLASQEHAGETISLIQPQSTFQATLPVMTPGFPHKVTIRVPATRATNVRVDVASSEDRSSPAVSFVLVSDPIMDEHDQWSTHTFVHYPIGDDQIWLTNLDRSTAAAFESVSVQAGPSHLATISQPEPGPRSAVMRLTSIDWVDALAADVTKRIPLDDCDPATIAMYRLWVASDRLRDHALATGMNGIMVPANSGGRTWFDSESLFPCRDLSARDVGRLLAFMRLMERSHLRVFIDLRPSMLLSGPEQALRTQPALASQLTRSYIGSGDQYNPLHPLVQRSLASLLSEIERQCGGFSCFGGITLWCTGPSHLQPLRDASDDLGTMALFAQASRATISPSQLQMWVKQQGKTDFGRWLVDATAHSYEFVGNSLQTKPVIMVVHDQPLQSSHPNADSLPMELFAERWRGDGKQLLAADSFRYGSPLILAKRALLQQQLASVATPATGSAVAAILGDETDPDEPVFARPQLMDDIVHIIDRLDPSMLIVDLPTVGGRLDSELAQMLRSFTAMPAECMRRVDTIDPASQTVHVTSGSKDGHLYVSVISLAPWASEVELESSAPIDWVLMDQSGASELDAPVEQIHATRTRVAVPAGQLIVLQSRTPAAGAAIKSWSSRVSGGPEALEGIKRQVTTIVERIGILSEFNSCDALSNGGFEQSGGMGLVGWLHAQHPPGCVRVDETESVEGKKSVLLTTDAAISSRTWIVSETIDPPRSGRLAVSLACRGELKRDDSGHRLRVSIEATRDGEPIRYSSEFNVPQNGQWGSRDVVLEADGIEGTSLGSLRLTIDSLSGGRVWIDDVRLHDQFPTAKERAELQSQAFLAVQGLQRGNLTPSARLLHNHWARYLLILGPAQQSRQVIEAVTPADDAPGVAERILGWLPRPLRF